MPTAVRSLEELLKSRHSCRAFKADPVPQPVLESILGMAQQSASWCNVQPWTLIITSGAATERFRHITQQAYLDGFAATDIPFPSEYRDVHLDRRRSAGFRLYQAVGVPRGDRSASERQAARNYDLFDAPHVALVSIPRYLGPYALVDCGSWIATFMLAAQAHGVATIAQAAIARCGRALRAAFDVPDDQDVVCGLSLGYEDASHPANHYRTDREAIANYVHWHNR